MPPLAVPFFMRVWYYAWWFASALAFPSIWRSACGLEGRHGGLVGTKALGEEDGPCLLGMIMGLCLFFCVFCTVAAAEARASQLLKQHLPNSLNQGLGTHNGMSVATRLV